MRVPSSLRRGLLSVALISALYPAYAPARPEPGDAEPPAVTPTPARDGAHDFDWDLGAWTTHQHRRLHPLTGSTTWVDYHGTDVVHKLWDGANWGMVEADGPAGHLQIYTIRLYNPDTHEWTVNFTNPSIGALATPVTGGFKDGRAEFYDQEFLGGRTIMVRFSISGITADTCHFEQAFSADGGKTWEVNFIVDEERVKGGGDKAP